MALDYRDRYLAFQQALQQFQTNVTGEELRGSRLQDELHATQQLFQQILYLDLEGLNSANVARVQSYQTEINKQLRLLSTDLVFLQTARQSATVQQRQTQIGDRISTLIRYCEAVLEGLGE